MNILRLYHTLTPLRWPQFWYRFWYPVKRKIFKPSKTDHLAILEALKWPTLKLFTLPAFDLYNPQEKSFTLLNIKYYFKEDIDWNTNEHGRLWQYHLNYFGWLEDESLSVIYRLETLETYATAAKSLKTGIEPYPISLRGIVIIRFLLKNKLQPVNVITQLHEHYNLLYHYPEYHLQGNHLWQNGASLIVAGYFYKNISFYKKGKAILSKALTEQILPDGGHIEGSPMYHSLLLSSLFQCIEIAGYTDDDFEFQDQMKSKAALMLGWLDQVTFSNGLWPNIGDSTGGIAPDLNTLKDFARSLSIMAAHSPLKESGYRMLRNERFELFADVCKIQPAWQPGHAHSDELSFCLNVDGNPFIVDPGINTYEEGQDRDWQRSSAAHNSLSVIGKNASDVWKSFRVGRKANVFILEDQKYSLTAKHDGYSFFYTRKFHLNKNSITFEDQIEEGNEANYYLNLYFAPNIFLNKYSDSVYLAQNLQIEIRNHGVISLETYFYSEAFNKQVPAQRLHIKASQHTITSLRILDAN